MREKGERRTRDVPKGHGRDLTRVLERFSIFVSFGISEDLRCALAPISQAIRKFL